MRKERESQMNLISRKLRSNSGASMILALVFMLFCMFVGGTVLAAASANGYRVAHLSDQQQYLDERSAAFLTAEELRISTSLVPNHQLIVTDAKQVVQKVIVGNGGVYTPDPDSPATTSHVITFSAPAGLVMTPFQRLMYETAVLRYIQQNSIDTAAVQIRLENFAYSYNNTESSITSITEFWVTGTSGTLNISGVKDTDNSVFASFPAEFACQGGSDLYDFTVDFGDFSQMSVVLNASVGERKPVVQSTIDEWTQTITTTEADGTQKNTTVTYPALITTTSKMPVILWETATIEKGGS